MTMMISARYVDGAFRPEGEIAVEEGASARIMISGNHMYVAGAEEIAGIANALISAAETEFDHAFGADGRDNGAIARGCGFAWQSARISARRAAQALGLPHETIDDLKRLIYRLDGDEDLAYFNRFILAEACLERSGANDDEIGDCFLREEWQFAHALESIRELVGMLAADTTAEASV